MRWSQTNVPHKGWTEIAVYDLADETEDGEDIAYETCDMCGNEKIRFIHVMQHPDYPELLHVGCDCAEKMTDDYVGPRESDNVMRNRTNRRYNFMKQQWRLNSKGNYVLKYKGAYITVMKSNFSDGYGVIYNGKSIWNYKGNIIPDLETAKVVAFEAFDGE